MNMPPKGDFQAGHHEPSRDSEQATVELNDLAGAVDSVPCHRGFRVRK